ncbi:hypothetical protein ACHAXT_003554 [Thalassiosira profunda]
MQTTTKFTTEQLMHIMWTSTARRRRRRRGRPALLSIGLGSAVAAAMDAVETSSAIVDAPSLVIDPSAHYVRLVEAPAATAVGACEGASPGCFGRSSGGLARAMGELREALSDTRRILEEDMEMSLDAEMVDEMGVGQKEEMHEHMHHAGEEGNTSNEEGEGRQRSSSDWWERMYQGGPLYDQWTGKLIEETKEGDGIASRPANRRSHSAAVYRHTENNGAKKEWMIISGGFTDEDWDAFPVWAYDLANGRGISEIEDELKEDWVGSGAPDSAKNQEVFDKLHDPDIAKDPWIDLTGLSSSDDSSTNEGAAVGLGEAPQGRVGHLSSVHNDCLYIYGGLTYRMGTFHVDYAEDEGENNSIAVWKACGLDGLLSTGTMESVDEGDRGKRRVGGLVWERVKTNVDTRPPVQPADLGYDDVDEPSEATHKDEGNGNGNEEGEEGGDDRKRRRIQRVPWSASNPSNSQPEDLPPGTIATPPQQTLRIEAIKPAVTLPRGEAQGGDYRGGGKDSFVFYGGMHHHHSLTETNNLQATTILGDVWSFEYETETLRLLSPYPPLPFQRDDRFNGYPKARTAHAGTVVGDELIIHGGMHFGDEDVEDAPPSSFSSPSNTYATYKTTSSSWQALSDIWSFNLKTLRWTERMMYPQLARSYHSMVGWENGTVAAFGGFQQDNNLPRETIAFVFKDLLVSRPNETYWQKLIPPSEEGVVANWHSSSGYTSRPGITNRLEHTAVLDEKGSMYIWGGRFQSVKQITGLWRADVFTNDAKLSYENAPPDGIDQYEAELEALHMFIATMMFMSLTISSIFSMMRRQAAEGEDGGGGGGARSILGRRGLSREVIDSLPLKRYEALHTEVTDDGDVVEDESLSRENSRDESSGGLEENLDCCAICLVPYEDGVSEIRTLPCGHVFDRECIDAWFADHTTCPSCRSNVAESSSHSEGEMSLGDAVSAQMEFDPRFMFLTAFDGSSRRRHGHWNNNTGTASLSGLAHTNASLASTDASSQDSHENESPNAHEHDAGSLMPRFLGIRRFFNRRGHHGVAVPSDEEAVNNESIELV